MKKNIVNLLILGVITLLVTSCNDKYPIKYDESNIIVGMNSTTLSVRENSTGTFGIYLGAVTGTPATDVVIQVSTDGISNPAIEGTDFTLSSKSINVPVGVTMVTVNPVDNSIFTGDKKFKVTIVSNSKNYDMAVQQSITVTIVDDEHPLKNWIGTYTVEAASYGSPGAWDETWTVTTSPVPSDPTKLSISGISAAGSGPVIATLNTNSMTIELESAQDLGEVYPGNGNIAIYYATDELLALAGNPLNTSIIETAGTHKIIGTIESDGTIKIDRFALVMTDYVWSWDVFNTTWTKN
jgi:hypothetical protein